MNRLHIFLVSALATLTLTACTAKPSEENCRKAILNMRRLMGTENIRDDAGIQGEVRRCKGGSKKKAVDCAIAAQSLDDLRKCSFFKVPDNAPGIDGTTMGSSSPTMGSAGSATTSGSADTNAAGSAGSATMTGSAGSAAMTGSAGSAAMTGSAGATGSAAAATTGSASGTTTGNAAGSGSAAPAGAMPGTPAGSGVTR